MKSQHFVVGILGVLLAAAIWWIQPLFMKMASNQDLWIHLRWADQFHTALLEGNLLPRWAYASHEGLGDPTFVYYQPLFYYFCSMLSMVGLEPEHAVLYAAGLPYLMVSAVAFCMLRRHALGIALGGAIFVVVSPALLFISTNLSSFPWTLSVPFSILFLVEGIRARPRPILLALLLAGVCLSHILSGFMMLCSVALSRLVLYFPSGQNASRQNLSMLMNCGGGIIFGLGLAAFFVYPAVSQMHLINPSGWTNPNLIDWRETLIFPLLHTVSGGNKGWTTPQWLLPAYALAMSVLVLLASKEDDEDVARSMAITALCMLALGSELAYPLYAYFTPMLKIQFPYRFVLVASFMASIGFVIVIANGKWRRWSPMLRLGACGLVALYCLHALHLQRDLSIRGVSVPKRAIYMKGDFGQPEYLLAVAGKEWGRYLSEGKLEGECRRLAVDCTAIQHTHAFTADITTDRHVQVRLPIFAFPAWKVSVNQIDHPLVPDARTGLVLVDLTPGRHHISLEWKRLPADLVGLKISLASVLMLLSFLFLKPFSTQLISLMHARVSRQNFNQHESSGSGESTERRERIE